MDQLKFDTVQLVTSSKYLLHITDNLFKHEFNPASGEIISVEYQSKHHPDITPYKLYIRANYLSRRLTIEFSSKILLSDYPQSISSPIFKHCLAQISLLGICTLDIEGIVKDCYFNKLHIVKDIDLPLTSEMLGRLNQCTGDYRRYRWKKYKSGILFTRDVTAADCRESLTLYNKEVEIARAENRPFLAKCGGGQDILEHFTGKTRLEVKLENKRKIQKILGIANTDFESVMGCRKNVVLEQFDKIFGSDTPKSGVVKLDNIVDYGLWCIIRLHNFDLRSIEQEIKDLHIYEDKTKGAMGKQMKKIREMIATYHAQQGGENDVVTMVRALL